MKENNHVAFVQTVQTKALGLLKMHKLKHMCKALLDCAQRVHL